MMYHQPSELTFGPTKGRQLRNVKTHIIWANQKTESLVYCWLQAHAMFDVTRSPAFVGALNVLSSVLSIHEFPDPGIGTPGSTE